MSIPPELIPDWPTTGFRQLTKSHLDDMPKITEGQIKKYFQFRMATDLKVNNDLKALVKGKALFESERVVACSFVVVNHVYFSGIVGAMFKKAVKYVI